MRDVRISAAGVVLDGTLVVVVVEVLEVGSFVVADCFPWSSSVGGLLIVLEILCGLPFVVSHIFGPDSQVATDRPLQYGPSTTGDFPPGVEK